VANERSVLLFRAVLGRPRLSSAAALAVVSASTAGVAAVTGHAPAISHVVDASADASPARVVNAGFAEKPAIASDAAAADLLERTRQRSAVVRTIIAERLVTAARAARSAERKALLSADPKVVAQAMLHTYGWGASQFACLDRLWTRESMWSLTATNASSGAYGIPQALPGSKMASAGSDWRHNPLTQIRWGLGYIRARYGTPCSAWGHSEASGWY
jgi:hypothetical protein